MTAIFGMMLAGLVVQDAVARGAAPARGVQGVSVGASAPQPPTGTGFPLADDR